MIQKNFNTDIEPLFAGLDRIKEEMKNEAFFEREGFTDSIKFCLKNEKIPIFHNILNGLIRPAFLQEYIQKINIILSFFCIFTMIVLI